MKITITYGNKACIPTGVTYENINPFYSINAETETTPELSQEWTETSLKRIKEFVDNQILNDMSQYRNFKKECKCNPIWNQQTDRLQHNMDCPLCHSEDK